MTTRAFLPYKDDPDCQEIPEGFSEKCYYSTNFKVAEYDTISQLQNKGLNEFLKMFSPNEELAKCKFAKIRRELLHEELEHFTHKIKEIEKELNKIEIEEKPLREKYPEEFI